MERQLIRAQTIANRTTANKVIVVLRAKSSGRFTYAQLARMDHPYALRHFMGQSVTTYAGKMKLVSFPGVDTHIRNNVPYGDTGIINSQSGVFKACWIRVETAMGSGVIAQTVWNCAPYAQALEKGIPQLTINRPILKFAVAYVSENYANILSNEIEKVLDRILG